MRAESCTWCGTRLDPGDAYRVYAPAGARRAVFCRLEHIVAWGIAGAHWEAGREGEAARADAGVTSCALCDAPLDDRHVLLVRVRGEHSIPDGFCSVDHLVEWSRSGGRWARAR